MDELSLDCEVSVADLSQKAVTVEPAIIPIMHADTTESQ